MTMGEDLLLLYIRPRGVEYISPQIGLALQAAELVELAAAGRIRLDDNRIVILNRATSGVEPLDRALKTLQDDGSEMWLDRWRRDALHYVKPYMTTLADQGVLRIGARGLRPEYSYLDAERRAQALARVDRVVHNAPDATAADWALAALVHACGLDRRLYRGLRGRAARRRLALLADNAHIAAGTEAATDAADAAFTSEAARALLTGLDVMNGRTGRSPFGQRARFDSMYQLMDFDPTGPQHHSHHHGSGGSHHHHGGHSGGHHGGDFGGGGHSGGHDGGGGHY